MASPLDLVFTHRSTCHTMCMGKGCSSAAPSFLPFNLDAATSAQVLTPLLSSRVQHPCQASKSFQNSLLPLLLGLPHSNLSLVAPPQDQLLPFLLTIGSETPLTETNSREPGLGQSPVPFRPGVPTCSPAAGKDLSVSQNLLSSLRLVATSCCMHP